MMRKSKKQSMERHTQINKLLELGDKDFKVTIKMG